MRKVVYGGACSLDMYLAREDGSVDWLIMDEDAMELMAGMWDRFGVMVMGRKTWEVAMSHQSWSSGGENESTTPSSEADATPPVQEGSPLTYVFSRSLKAEKKGAYEVIDQDPAEFLRDLTSKPGKDICVMGGGEIGSLLLDAGLVDEVGFNIHPVLLGSGVPAFTAMSRQIHLELVESKALRSGCVYVNYRVKN